MVIRPMLTVSEAVGGTGQSRSHLARYITPTPRHRYGSLKHSNGLVFSESACFFVVGGKKIQKNQHTRLQCRQVLATLRLNRTMPTTPPTIRPPKSCFHAYYALDPAIHTGRIIAVLIWAGSPSTTRFAISMSTWQNQSCCYINFIRSRVIFDVLTNASIFDRISVNAIRFVSSMSIIRSMHYFRYARLDKSIADNLCSYIMINFI